MVGDEQNEWSDEPEVTPLGRGLYMMSNATYARLNPDYVEPEPTAAELRLRAEESDPATYTTPEDLEYMRLNPPDEVELFDSAEEAALSQWAGTPAAGAKVEEVRPSSDDAAVWVVLRLASSSNGFHDRDIITCVRTPDGLWWAAGSTVG